MKKLLSILLAVAMLFSLAIPALAEEEVPNYDHLIMPLDTQTDVGVNGDDQIVPISDDAIVIPGQDVTDTMRGSIVLLHSNDVHGAVDGYAKMATVKEMYTIMGADVYLLDAGDFIQGETAVSVSQGATAVELMDMVGYDVAVPGNHEFDYGYENLQKLSEEADFPLLAANVTYNGAAAFGDHVIFEASDGRKVGVFGLTTPETATKAHPAKIAGVKFAGGEELYAVAQAQVDALKAEGVDYIVCLGHLGIDEETALTANRSIDVLEKVNGIDIFIDGHSHSTLEEIGEKVGEARTVNGAVLTSTGTKFASVGAVVIDPEGAITVENWPAQGVGTAKGAIADRAAAIKAEIEDLYGAVFAKSEVDLNGERDPGNRTQETNLGDLICDAMLWYVTKEGELDVPASNVVALTNGGGIRASIAAGDISRNDVNKVLPFGNTVATVYVTGRALREALEASTFCTPTAVGGFPQVAGIDFSVDTSMTYHAGDLYPDTTYAAPASIGRVTVNAVNGAAFDPAATYAVVTNDFVAAGGDTYYTFSTSPNIVDTGVPLDEALMAYITEELHGIIGETYAEPQGRIKVNYVGVEPGAWYVAAAKDVMDKGVMTGTDQGFAPSATVTRATVFQTLYNLEGKPAQSAPEGHLLEMNEALSGISGHWWTDAARWAYNTGVTTGAEGGVFAGDREVTRSEIVTILQRYAQYKGLDMTAGEEVNLLTAFVDAEEVAPWAVEPFQWAVGAKVISGKSVESGTALASGDTATRAELAQMLSNYLAFFPQSAR